MGAIWNWIKTNVATTIATLFLSIITIFSNTLTERIKFALNRADLRTTSYEKITHDVSGFVFFDENATESLKQGLTDKNALTNVITPYNDAITELRSQEYVIRSWLNRYWQKEDMDRFEELMQTVKDIDQQFHRLNPEFVQVVYYKKKSVDTTLANKTINELEKLNPQLEKQVKEFVLKLI